MSHSQLEKYTGWSISSKVYMYQVSDLKGNTRNEYFSSEITEKDHQGQYYQKRNGNGIMIKFTDFKLVENWEDRFDETEESQELGYFLKDFVVLDYNAYVTDPSKEEFDYEVDIEDVQVDITQQALDAWIEAGDEPQGYRAWLSKKPRLVHIKRYPIKMVWGDSPTSNREYESTIEFDFSIQLVDGKLVVQGFDS